MISTHAKRITASLALSLAACGVGGGSIEIKQSALGADGGAQFENVPGDDSDPFQQSTLPPSVAARLHNCQKLPYATLGNLLASRGVNLDAVAAKGQLPTAGQLYKSASATLGAPNYATRTRELITPTTSSATKMMDVYLMAAPEIIAAMPSLSACQIAGQPAHMFDANTGACTREGIMCLTGAPVVSAQLDLCNQMLHDVPGATGQQLAVAAILAAAHTCE